MLPVLSALQKHKYDHEIKAKDRLIGELKNPIIKKIFETGGFGGEHRIVVFGKSGVGKTTLILKLLGAKSSEFDPEFNIVKLSENMRGNIKNGGAGTVTVYHYKVSLNEVGKITLPGNKNQVIEFIELSKLKENLLNIRRKVECGEWKHTDPVNIELPKQYFEAVNEVPWAITDIPGINSTTKSEYGHVSDLVKAYVLQCNVLLILEHANEIGQLNRLKIPDFGSWHYFGRRCRLIITHSMEEDNVKTKFKNLGGISTKLLIDYFKGLLDGDSIITDGINGIFPLDYGKSWESLFKNEKKLFNKVNKAVLGVELELKKNLKESMSIEEEAKCLIQIGHLEDKFNKERNKYEKEISSLESEKTKCEETIENYDKKIQDKTEERNKLNKEKASWNKKEEEIFKNPWKDYPKNDLDYDKEHPDGHSKSWIDAKNDFYKKIGEHSQKILKDREKIARLREKEYPTDYPFRKDWKDHLDENTDWGKSDKERFYNWNETYKHTLFRRFKNKKRTQAREAHRRAVRVGIEKEFNWWTPKIKDIVKNELKNKISKIDNRLGGITEAIRHYNAEIKRTKTKINEKENLIKEKKDRLKELAKSKNEDMSAFSELYPKFRHEELKNVINLAKEKVKTAKSPLESFQHLAFINQVINISKTIQGK